MGLEEGDGGERVNRKGWGGSVGPAGGQGCYGGGRGGGG